MLPKNEPTFEAPWLIDDPMLESAEPTPVPVLVLGADCGVGAAVGVLGPRGIADNEPGGVMGDALRDTEDGAGDGAGAAGAAAVVCHADVAAPELVDVTGGAGGGGAGIATGDEGWATATATGLAGAVLATLPPGFRFVGTRVPSPASL